MPDVFTPPRRVPTLDDCGFYHSVDLPGHGFQEGLWDLRATVGAYLGYVEKFAGKTVLEIGCASGFLSFHMESKGAEVIAYDLSENDRWDVVPYANTTAAADSDTLSWRQWSEKRSADLRRLNNAFWFSHRAFQSKVRLVQGNVYQVPKAIGQVDICTFGSILLHLRDPFRALHRSLRLTRETAIITDLVPWATLGNQDADPDAEQGAYAFFMPDAAAGHPIDSWWQLTPELVVRMIAVLGFEDARIYRFTQPHSEGDVPMYSIVAQRTVEVEDLEEIEP